MNRITLKQLRYFLAVSETGSIALAAANLRSSAPTVSSGIRNLEVALNVELFARHHARGVTLTPAGQQLLERATQLVSDAQEIESFAKVVSDEAVGTVTIGCYPTLAPIFMPVLITQVKEENPEIELNFVEAPEQRLFQMLEEGDIDLVLSYSHCLPDNLMKNILHKARTHCLLPADHDLARRDGPVSLSELVNEPMILMDTEPGRKHFIGIFEQHGLVPRFGYKTSSFEVLRGLVGCGLGYSLLITQTHSEMTYSGHCVVRKAIKENLPLAEICLTRLSTSRLPLVTKLIMRHCKSISVRQYEEM